MAAAPQDVLPDRLVEHHLSGVLNHELDARPPTDLASPALTVCLTVVTNDAERRLEPAWLADFARSHRADAERCTSSNALLEAGELRLKCERHAEFTSYFLYAPWPQDFTPTATLADLFPTVRWRTLPGRLLHTCAISVLPQRLESSRADPEHDDPRVAAAVANGAAIITSDYRVTSGGHMLFRVEARDVRRHVIGRVVQSIHEIESYRMMSLLALPLARDVARAVSEGERQLAELSGQLVFGSQRSDDELLDRLLTLAAEVERSVELTHFRFSAAAAYYAIVRKRIEDLRELPAGGEATIGEFLDRRLAPAMRTCESAAARQESLSARIQRAAMLLRTRVEIARHHEASSMLAALNRRLQLQLRLQQTVEGLSFVAMTYYGVALAAYLLKGMQVYWPGLSLDVAVSASAPVIACGVWFAIRRIKRAAGTRQVE